jgi:hypothetical protein
VSFYVCPTYNQPLVKNGQTSSPWYRFFQAVFEGTPPSAEVTIPINAFPFSYTAPVKGFLIVSGGTVTSIQFTRTVTTLTGQTSGIFPLSQGDTLTITYLSQPNLLWVPQ